MTHQLSPLFAYPREPGHNQATRRRGDIPAVIYGYGLLNINIQINHRAFSTLFNQAGYTSLITLTVKDNQADQDHTVLIRDLQLHPLKDTVIHVDFYQPRLDQVITANVPLRFIGAAPAVKDLGGVLIRALDEVELQALPTDLPHDIAVDISVLTNFDQAIHIRDLRLPDKVELHHEPDQVVALVQPPRSEEEIKALDEEVQEDVTSVEGVKEEEKTDETAAKTTDEPVAKTETDDSSAKTEE